MKSRVVAVWGRPNEGGKCDQEVKGRVQDGGRVEFKQREIDKRRVGSAKETVGNTDESR